MGLPFGVHIYGHRGLLNSVKLGASLINICELTGANNGYSI